MGDRVRLVDYLRARREVVCAPGPAAYVDWSQWALRSNRAGQLATAPEPPNA
jgi:hypothetical protein